MKAITTLFLATALLASAEPDAAAMADGKANFMNCMACHGLDGTGMKVGPTMVMAPSLAGSKIATGDPEIFAQVVLKGIKKEGVEYLQMMLPLEATLDDKKLASVMTYVRSSFDNKADPVTEAQVKEWRAKFADRKEPLTRAEIAELTKKSEEANKKPE
jgi:mono/diheme cytochrome c family protein